MAEANDFIKTRVVNVISGQQTQMSMFWQVAAVLGADSLSKVVSDLAVLYWNSIRTICPTAVNFQAFTWENASRNEKQIVYPNLNGISAGDSHSPYNCIRMNIWGEETGPPIKVRRNAINVPGIRESASVKGVMERGSSLASLRNFLSQQVDTDVTGLQLNPMVRWRTAVGPPATYDYTNVTQVQENPVFNTLRSRRPSLI